MRINIGKDVGIPLGVGVADVLVGFWDEKRLVQNAAAMRFEPIFGVVAPLAGIGMMAGNFYSEVGEVIAHSGFPLAVRAVYDWARQQTWFGGGAQRLTRAAVPMQVTQVAAPMRRVGYGYPAPSEKPEFAGPPLF